MTNSRDNFLQRVRQALADGNKAGYIADLPSRGTIGYQGAGTNFLQRFVDELTTAGGFPYVVSDPDAARKKTLELIQARSVKKILLAGGELIDSLELDNFLREGGYEVLSVQDLTSASSRDGFFAADIGISGVAYLVAETGSVVMASRPGEPRSVSLLPPVHIALAQKKQLVPDLFDLFQEINGPGQNPPTLPSCLTLITGPSKTGDIELRLVTGVHGPGEIHVILME